MRETMLDRALRRVGLIRLRKAHTMLDRFQGDRDSLVEACARENDNICQTLGTALGYPRYVDDQTNFPGAVEADGVCVGEHVAGSIAMEAARAILRYQGDDWFPIGQETPENRWLETWRKGERETTLAFLRRWPDGDEEWVAPDGRTTITHGSYAAPTHYRMPSPVALGVPPRANETVLPCREPHFVWDKSSRRLTWSGGAFQAATEGGKPRLVREGSASPLEGSSWLILRPGADTLCLEADFTAIDGCLCVLAVNGDHVHRWRGRLTVTNDHELGDWAA